ncbi:hypothetical protein RRF57_008267 [Xylaria bambusicola]|uniref:Uncharacterized protein n=1 Tax=Xylaria bambusicola TaxID=326684 RepID=A0AAN7UTA1_9PEZI
MLPFRLPKHERKMPNERGRSGGRGFELVAQADTDDYGRDEVEHQRLSGRERFSRTVKEMLRQNSASQIAPLLDARSSPASSESTLTDGNYLRLPIQQFDEVNITDGHERYAEAAGFYGPGVVDKSATLSPSLSTKAGKDLQVNVQSYPLALSPGGLHVDDRIQDLSYRGSEASISKPDSDPSLYNYRPVPLRWRFLLILLGGLIVLLALSQLGLHLLPEASNMDENHSVLQNANTAQKRSDPYIDAAGNYKHLIEYENHTESTVSTHTTSTTKVEDQPTSSTQSSSSTTLSSTVKPSSTTQFTPTTESTTESSTTGSSTTHSSTRSPTTQSSTVDSSPTDSSSTQPSSTIQIPSPTHSTSVTKPSSPIQSSPTMQPSSSAQFTSYTESSSTRQPSSTVQFPSSTMSSSSISPLPSTTPSSVTETATDTTETQISTTQDQNTKVTTTTMYSPTQTDEHQSTKEQSTATPKPNDSGPNDQSSSTQSRPEPTSTNDDQNLPTPSSGHTNTTSQDTITPPLQTSTAGPPPTPTDEPLPQPTISSPATTSTGVKSGSLMSRNLPSSLDGPHDHPADQSGHQSTDPPEGKADDGVEDHNGSSSPTNQNGPSLVTSTQVFPNTANASKVTSGIKINTSSNRPVHIASPSTSTPLPDRVEENGIEDSEPFTTITMTQNVETSSWPVTTVFATSSSIAEGSFIEITITTTIHNHIKLESPLSDFRTTITYANGTVATISLKVHDTVSTLTEFDAESHATATKFAHILRASQKTTLRDPHGFPTATLDYYDVESTTTLYDSNHIPTATLLTTIPETPVTSTLYDTNGVPTQTTTLLRPIVTDTKVVVVTPTPTSWSSPDNGLNLKPGRMPDGIYFIGFMLPTLLAISAFIPIRVLNRNVMLYQGFQALASSRGANASESLCLKTTGPLSLLFGILSLQNRQYLLGLTSILVVLSALTIPFSTEAFPLLLQRAQCHPDGVKQLECPVVLGVSPVHANVLSGLLIVIIVGAIVAALLLWRWKTGVERDPWSISEMTQLAAHTDMQGILERLRRRHKAGLKVDATALADALQAKTFGLHEWEEENGVAKRGVLILLQQVGELAEKPVKKAGRSVTFADTGDIGRRRRPHWSSGESIPFFMLSWTGRILMLSSLSGLLIAALTYDIIVRGSDNFAELTRTTASVRFLFSGAGVLVVFAWGSFFNGKTIDASLAQV